jgi:hypothetical protein
LQLKIILNLKIVLKGDVTDSQRSTSVCDQSSLHTSEVLSKSLVATSSSILESTTSALHSTVTTTTTTTTVIKTAVSHAGLSNTAAETNTPSKLKLNKEEIKLSPIQKKSMSSSSLLADAERIDAKEDVSLNYLEFIQFFFFIQ